DPRVPALGPLVTKHDTSKSAPKKQAETEPEEPKDVLVDVRTQSYVQVFHSVHRISREIMEAETKKSASFAPDPAIVMRPLVLNTSITCSAAKQNLRGVKCSLIGSATIG